jgi:hypothetical protein
VEVYDVLEEGCKGLEKGLDLVVPCEALEEMALHVVDWNAYLRLDPCFWKLICPKRPLLIQIEFFPRKDGKRALRKKKHANNNQSFEAAHVTQKDNCITQLFLSDSDLH